MINPNPGEKWEKYQRPEDWKTEDVDLAKRKKWVDIRCLISIKSHMKFLDNWIGMLIKSVLSVNVMVS